MASFDALYAANPRPPVMPIDDAKFTMRPHPCCCMCGYTGLHRPQRALDAGRVEDVDVAFADLGDRRHRPEGLRVVDEAVDAAEPLDRLRDHRVDLVALLGCRSALRGSGCRASSSSAHVCSMSSGFHSATTIGGPALAEMERHALADALARAGDDHDLAVDGVHRVGCLGRERFRHHGALLTSRARRVGTYRVRCSATLVSPR